MLKTICRLAVLVFICCAAPRAWAATVSATYVKTLGQSNTEGKFNIVTAGGRIAVDEKGNAYFGTPGGYSFLQKVTPDGKIVWQNMLNVPGFQGAAVDEKYLYTCGSGYYGRIQLQRWLRDTGEAAPGWQYDWENSSKELNGVRAFQMPRAVAVDDKYLFVADTSGNEVRRFDKASGQEAPFKNRLLVVAPNDLAFSPKGTLFILTESAVVEVTKDGEPQRVPVVAGLHGPTALDVNRAGGSLYIAEGGTPEELVNRVRIYSDDGKLQDEIGIGGDFNGKWYPLSFAFSSGQGDITLDANGGMWVNSTGHRLNLCPVLIHLTASARPTADVVLRGVQGTGLSVDGDLNVYVGGNYKIGWDDKLLWTSGLIAEGPARLFPTTLSGWIMAPVWADDKTAVVASIHQNLFYQMSAKNGAALGKTIPTGTGSIGGVSVAGRDVFYTGKGRTIQRSTLDLAAPQDFMTLPDTAPATFYNLAVSPDQQLFYVTDTKETFAYRRDGGLAWKAKGNLGTLFKGVVFTMNPDGAGIAALDAATGQRIGLLGDKDENGRAAIYGFTGIAGASKDGADYLFIMTNSRILVYHLAIG